MKKFQLLGASKQDPNFFYGNCGGGETLHLTIDFDKPAIDRAGYRLPITVQQFGHALDRVTLRWKGARDLERTTTGGLK
jgi:hypothetical protein